MATEKKTKKAAKKGKAIDLQQKKNVVKACEQLMQRLLANWLTKEELSKVRLYVKYYHPEGRIEMYYAMLQYLMTGKKAYFKNGAAQWHFGLFCEMVDKVGYSYKAHQHLMKLWNKIGLFEPVPEEEAAEETDTEEMTIVA